MLITDYCLILNQVPYSKVRSIFKGFCIKLGVISFNHHYSEKNMMKNLQPMCLYKFTLKKKNENNSIYLIEKYDFKKSFSFSKNYRYFSFFSWLKIFLIEYIYENQENRLFFSICLKVLGFDFEKSEFDMRIFILYYFVLSQGIWQEMDQLTEKQEAIFEGLRNLDFEKLELLLNKEEQERTFSWLEYKIKNKST